MSGKHKSLFKNKKEEEKHFEQVHDYYEKLADERLRVRKEESKNPFGNH